MLRAIPIRDAQGKVVRWYGSVSDIHDLKLAVDQRKQAADRLASLLDSVGNPVITLGDGERISHANAAAQRLFGRSRDNLVGRVLGQALPDLGTVAFRETFREVASAGHEKSLQARLKKPADGGDVRFNVRVFPNTDGIGLFFEQEDTAGQRVTPSGADGAQGGGEE
jgi:PAS domain S-box-containing protein